MSGLSSRRPALALRQAKGKPAIVQLPRQSHYINVTGIDGCADDSVSRQVAVHDQRIDKTALWMLKGAGQAANDFEAEVAP